MIFDTTYTDKEVTKEINNLVGQSFSFWDRLKLGGIGSRRLVIKGVSESLEQYINPGLSTNYTNIELRPGGIIIHLKRRTQTYGWVIPFKHLTFNDDFSNVADDDHQVLLKDSLALDQAFLKKIQTLSVR